MASKIPGASALTEKEFVPRGECTLCREMWKKEVQHVRQEVRIWSAGMLTLASIISGLAIILQSRG